MDEKLNRTASGSVAVRLYTAGGLYPVCDARVTIVQNDMGLPVVIEYMRTDESGYTDDLRIATPARSASLSPGDGQKEPFATVSVRADHPDYRSILIQGVQIFPGTRSVQRIDMIPAREGCEAGRRLIVYDIAPQNL